MKKAIILSVSVWIFLFMGNYGARAEENKSINDLILTNGYVLVWEWNCKKDKKGYIANDCEDTFKFKFFKLKKDALKYMNDYMVKDMSWKAHFIATYTVSYGNSDHERGNFMGPYQLGKKLRVYKYEEVIQLTEEKWKIE